MEHPETIASAIRIGNPASWQGAVDAARESEGMIGMVSDEEILAAYGLLARIEGVFCEPASASGVAGLAKWAKENKFPRGTRVVCILTGHGLKDPDAAIKASPKPTTVAAEMKAVLAALKIG